MTCPNCAADYPQDALRCPQCGAENPLSDGAEATRSDWSEVVGGETRKDFQAPSSASPAILAFVALYADSAESAGGAPPPSLGRVYPLRKGDVLFLGKAPTPSEIPLPDGRKLLPTSWHLFPFSEDFAHISRRHLVVEMAGPGNVSLIDLSTNGVYLRGEGKHFRRGKGEAARILTVKGGENVVLGVDVGSTSDGALRDKAWRFELQIVPNTGASVTTTSRRSRTS